MGRRLKGFVPVHNEDGTTAWYGPGDEIPADVAKNIGDHAWLDDGADQADDESDSEGGATPPPMSGRGSGTDEWIGYARGHGLDVDDDAKREDVIDALRSAGVPVE